jgi:hypothetical protein
MRPRRAALRAVSTDQSPPPRQGKPARVTPGGSLRLRTRRQRASSRPARRSDGSPDGEAARPSVRTRHQVTGQRRPHPVKVSRLGFLRVDHNLRGIPLCRRFPLAKPPPDAKPDQGVERAHHEARGFGDGKRIHSHGLRVPHEIPRFHTRSSISPEEMEIDRGGYRRIRLEYPQIDGRVGRGRIGGDRVRGGQGEHILHQTGLIGYH